MVSIGDEKDLQIVCGAPNVAAGQQVIVATEGTLIHPFSGEPFRIKKAKIRGVVSEGMICAEDEIGISDNHGGIMVLPVSAKTGSWVKDFLEVQTDHILEIGLTPNRGDAMSHIGTARDLAAYLQATTAEEVSLKIPSVENFKAGGNTGEIEVTVEDAIACPRYSGISISV
jgi:phenylalanyl-tRNA synthetase beta chain